MSTFNIMSIIMSILHAQAVTVHAYDTTFIGAPHEEGKEATRVGLATRAEGGGGGVNIGAIIGAIAGVILILAALILIFVKSRNRNRNQPRVIQYNNNPPQKSIFALGPFKQPPQPLPLYTQPTSPYAQHYNGGLPMPQAVHPSTSGYYRQAGQVQQNDGVRFGGVGVVRY